MSDESIIFAGKALPRGVQSFSLKNAEGQTCLASGGEGVETGEFPISQLSAENIRATWGAGSYRVQFIGVRKGQRKPLGSRIVNVLPVTDVGGTPSPQATSPVVASSTEDPMVRAFQIVDAIDRRAQIAAERDRAFLTTVLEAGRAQQPAAPSTEVVALREQVAQLTATIQAWSEDDDEEDDEDDDDDEEEEGSSSGPFRPGESIKDTAVAEGMNALVGIVKDVAPAVAAFAAMKMKEVADEIARKQEAEQKRLAASNGAATQSDHPLADNRLHGEHASG